MFVTAGSFLYIVFIVTSIGKIKHIDIDIFIKSTTTQH